MTKMLLSVFVTVCLSNQVFAEHSFIDVLNHKHADTQKSKYTNFSGEWNGTCTINGEEASQVSTTIDNDAYRIRINDKDYYYNELHTALTSNKKGHSSIQIKFSFDDEGRVLNGEYIDMYYSYTTKTMAKDIRAATLSLNNGDLVIESEAQINGIPRKEICTFKKED